MLCCTLTTCLFWHGALHCRFLLLFMFAPVFARVGFLCCLQDQTPLVPAEGELGAEAGGDAPGAAATADTAAGTSPHPVERFYPFVAYAIPPHP